MVTRMLIPALLAALALSACMPPPEERDATQAPSGTGAGSSSADKFSTVSCSGGSAAYTITGQLTDSASTGVPINQAKVFALGLPCRLATVDGSGNYTLAISSTDAMAAGLGTGAPVTIIALLVNQSFSKVAAGRNDISSLAETHSSRNITLNWGIAFHVAVNFSDNAQVAAASLVGISDSASLGIDMTQIGSLLGQPYDFDTNYLPNGTFTVRIESTSGEVFLRPLFFNTSGATADAWLTTTLNL